MNEKNSEVGAQDLTHEARIRELTQIAKTRDLTQAELREFFKGEDIFYDDPSEAPPSNWREDVIIDMRDLSEEEREAHYRYLDEQANLPDPGDDVLKLAEDEVYTEEDEAEVTSFYNDADNDLDEDELKDK